MCRTGRLVWVGTENSTVAVYDLYKSDSKPIAELEIKYTAIKSMVILDDGKALFQVYKYSKVKFEQIGN